MVMEKTHDLIISGSGHAAGGTYETIDISGYGRVNGDIECEKFKVSGSAKISGNVKAEAFKVSGTAHHYGNVESRYLDISGSTSIDGHVAAAELTVSGSLKIGKHLSGEKLDVSGGIRVKESCAMEKFKVKGSFDIGGMLNADEIDVLIYHDSSAHEISGSLKCEEVRIRGKINVHGDVEAETFIAKGAFKVEGLLNAGTINLSIKNFVGQSEATEIGGDKIIVKRKNGVLGLFNKHNLLLAETIEGDDIYLEYTNAKTVRGSNVTIGPGCDIDKVEYKKEFYVSKDANVKDKQKVN